MQLRKKNEKINRTSQICETSKRPSIQNDSESKYKNIFLYLKYIGLFKANCIILLWSLYVICKTYDNQDNM